MSTGPSDTRHAILARTLVGLELLSLILNERRQSVTRDAYAGRFGPVTLPASCISKKQQVDLAEAGRRLGITFTEEQVKEATATLAEINRLRAVQAKLRRIEAATARRTAQAKGEAA